MDNKIIRLVEKKEIKSEPVINDKLVSFLERQLKLAKEGNLEFLLTCGCEIENGSPYYCTSADYQSSTRSKHLIMLGQLEVLRNRMINWYEKEND